MQVRELGYLASASLAHLLTVYGAAGDRSVRSGLHLRIVPSPSQHLLVFAGSHIESLTSITIDIITITFRTRLKGVAGFDLGSSVRIINQ